jgi:hypothetical protein
MLISPTIRPSADTSRADPRPPTVGGPLGARSHSPLHYRQLSHRIPIPCKHAGGNERPHPNQGLCILVDYLNCDRMLGLPYGPEGERAAGLLMKNIQSRLPELDQPPVASVSACGRQSWVGPVSDAGIRPGLPTECAPPDHRALTIAALDLPTS